MPFARWFWRLFFVFAGLIAAQTFLITLFRPSPAGDSPLRSTTILLSAVLSIAIAAVATWYCVRRTAEPLEALSRHARSISGGAGVGNPVLDHQGEVGVLRGAFDQLER